MVEELFPPGVKEQSRQALFFSLESVGGELFLENPRIIKGIMDLEPSPLPRTPLMILRANKEDPAQGCFFGLSISPKEASGSGDSIESLFKDLCRRHDCPPRKVQAVVIFMEPEVNLLEDLGDDLREIINQLSSRTRLWFVEPRIIDKKLGREEKKARVRFLREALNLVDSKSVEAVSGLCYSTGRKKRRKKAKEPLLAQPELFA